MKTFDIFKPGKHVAASGDAFNFSEADALATVSAYDPAKHEAPIVVGHPKHDLPAYGWVKALSFNEGVTRAEPHQVDPTFAEMVGAGRFKKVSASFYHPESPSNPVPGVYYLRHVGFLGAQPPAVKGLRNPEFSDAEENIVTVEFGEGSYIWSMLSRLLRGLREHFIQTDGVEKADALIPNWQIEELQNAAVREAETNAVAPAFSETKPQGDKDMPGTSEKAALAAKEKELNDKEASFAEREARIAAGEKARADAENLAFCEQLIKDGNLHPAQKDNVAAILGALPSGQTIEFSEGDKKGDRALTDAFKAFLTAQPKLVEFAEAGKGGAQQVDITDPNVVAAKAVEFVEAEAKAGRSVTIAEAVQRVTAAAAATA